MERVDMIDASPAKAQGALRPPSRRCLRFLLLPSFRNLQCRKASVRLTSRVPTTSQHQKIDCRYALSKSPGPKEAGEQSDFREVYGELNAQLIVQHLGIPIATTLLISQARPDQESLNSISTSFSPGRSLICRMRPPDKKRLWQVIAVKVDDSQLTSINLTASASKSHDLASPSFEISPGPLRIKHRQGCTEEGARPRIFDRFSIRSNAPLPLSNHPHPQPRNNPHLSRDSPPASGGVAQVRGKVDHRTTTSQTAVSASFVRSLSFKQVAITIMPW